MIGDRDLLLFRQGYYNLLVSLFWKEPAGELLLHLSDGISERIQAAGNLHPLLAEGWEEIRRFFTETPPEDLAETAVDEYTRLFIGPYDSTVNPYESFYFTGRMWDRPLADLRTFLKTIGIEKQDGYSEPEDFIAFELEVMRWLIGKQESAAHLQESAAHLEEEKRWLQHQADFLKQHLLVWAPTCAQDIEKAKGAHFYRGVATILHGFLEVERNFFLEWGLDKMVSLEEARRRYGAIPMWKGPTFDFPGEEPKEPLPSGKK